MPAKPKPKLDEAVEEFYKQIVEKGLSDEELDFLHTLLGNEKIANEFKSGVHARRLTDRERDQLRTEKTRLENEHSRKVSELDTLRQTLMATSSSDKTAVSKLQNEFNQAVADKQALEGMLTKVKTTLTGYTDGATFMKEVGLDTFDLNRRTPAPPTDPPKPQDIKTISMEDVKKEYDPLFRETSQILARLPFDLMRYALEYKDLTGKEFDVADFHKKVIAKADANNGNVDYNQLYLEEYKIDDLREAKKVAGIRAEIEKEFNDKLASELNKRMMPSVNSATGKESDFFKAVDSTRPKESEIDSSNSMGINDRVETVNAAVEEYRRIQAANQARLGA